MAIARYVKGKGLVDSNSDLSEYKLWDHVYVKVKVYSYAELQKTKVIIIGLKDDMISVSPISNRSRPFRTHKSNICGRWEPTGKNQCGGYCKVHSKSNISNTLQNN